MSGLAAAVAFDRDPSIVPTVHLMLGAARHRGPGGTALWCDPNAAFGLLKRTAHDHSPSGPAREGRRALLFDGRIDNRADLLSRLSISPAATLDDAVLALRAFARLGDAAVEAIDGDFAVVFWDADKQRLVAARDRLGVRPLHWTSLGNRLLIASDIAQLVAAAGAVPPPDETAIADLLGGAPPADERTLFRRIQRVPAGSLLIADEDRIARRQYWAPSPAPTRSFRSDTECAEQCRSIIDEAVRTRLQGAGRPAVFFSGGVDSSIVLTVAASLGRRTGVPPPLAVSLALDDPAADEGRYQDAVRRELGAEFAVVRAGRPDAHALHQQAASRCCLPDLPSDFAGHGLRTAAKAAGARFALTGAGADALFGGSVHRYADLLSRGRFISAVREYVRDRNVDSVGWSRGALITAGVWPLIPGRYRARLRRVARGVSRIDAERPWLRLPRDLGPSVPDPPRGVSHASWELAWSLRDGWTAYFLESAERLDAEMGLEERHPLLDCRLIDFALALPEPQRYHAGVSKVVLRRAVPELPAVIRQRSLKADFSSLMRESLAVLGGGRFFQSLAIAEAGWVDGARLAARYDRLARVPAEDRQAARDLPILWMVAATDVWFRAVYGRKER